MLLSSNYSLVLVIQKDSVSVGKATVGVAVELPRVTAINVEEPIANQSDLVEELKKPERTLSINTVMRSHDHVDSYSSIGTDEVVLHTIVITSVENLTLAGISGIGVESRLVQGRTGNIVVGNAIIDGVVLSWYGVLNKIELLLDGVVLVTAKQLQSTPDQRVLIGGLWRITQVRNVTP